MSLEKPHITHWPQKEDRYPGWLAALTAVGAVVVGYLLIK